MRFVLLAHVTGTSFTSCVNRIHGQGVMVFVMVQLSHYNDVGLLELCFGFLPYFLALRL
jgi:hypothetical protein